VTFRPNDSGILAVPGASLYWESTGRGPALVLVHAGIADHTMWDDDVPVLAAGHRVVTYDGRGYGRSASTDVAFSNRADIVALLDHLGLDRAALLGCSRGGQIALDFALEQPGRVSALVLVASGPGGLQHDPTPEELVLFESEEPMWLAKDWAGVADLDVRLWVDGVGQAPDRVPASIRERVRTMSRANYDAEYPEGQPIVLDPPAAGRLGEVGVPTLIVHGDLDVSAIGAAVEALERGIAGARRVTLPGVAHMVNLERPVELRRVVLDFLAEVGA
jgi:pimeloyl-ACP methyl ester carboxylesterase